MLSTIPESRNPEILQRAVELFDSHLASKFHQSFTEKPQRDKTQKSGCRQDDPKRTNFRKPAISPEQPLTERLVHAEPAKTSSTHTTILFVLLCTIFSQYLFVFDGKKKLNQSIPGVYAAVVSEVEGFSGKPHDEGNNQSDNRRLH